MTKIYYWQGAQGERELLNAHHETIMRLLQRDYHHSDLEKLRGNHQYAVYSFRLNQTDRLLFTTQIVANKHYLHVLECVLNHDYQKSRFLQHRVLSNYLGKTIDNPTDIMNAFEALIDDDDRPCFESNPQSSSIEHMPLDYFNQQFIQLRDEQRQVISQSLPLIIDGVGGSGKTYIGLTFLKQFIQNVSYNEPARILYITKEASLVSTIKNHWADLNIMTPSTIQVEMLTYHELLPHDPQNDDTLHYQTWLSLQKKIQPRRSHPIKRVSNLLCIIQRTIPTTRHQTIQTCARTATRLSLSTLPRL